jgi:hypothetical protein
MAVLEICWQARNSLRKDNQNFDYNNLMSDEDMNKLFTAI